MTHHSRRLAQTPFHALLLAGALAWPSTSRALETPPPPPPPAPAPALPVPPDPPDEEDDDGDDVPPDADPAVSDIIQDMESTTGAGENGVPDVPGGPSEMAGEHALERAIRVDLLPPAAIPTEDSRVRFDSHNPQPAVGLRVQESLGTEGLGRWVRERRGLEEQQALATYLRKHAPTPRVSGPLSPADDIPMVDNDMVRRWITFFQGVGAKYYRLWVGRYWRYGPVMRGILEKEGLPSDTIFLSMIESGFSPKAYSFAHAAGPWQFIRSTGVRMGLRVNFWIDERRDPIKATHAAARYLRELHNTFHDWHLAWASYNAGPGRVARAMSRNHTREFFVIARTRALRWETRNYVPKLLAAATIGHDPAAYGFGDIEPLPLFTFDVLPLTENLHLNSVARACGTDVDTLQELNPSLRLPVVPPLMDGETVFELRVPPGSLQRCQEGMLKLTDGERARYRRHHVKPNDTLAAVATRFGTTAELILSENNLPNTRLRPGEDLLIPIPPGTAAPLGDVEDDVKERRGRIVRNEQPRGTRPIKVVVGKGDTLWDIASKHGVDVRSVAAWNGLNRRHRLRQGQQLTLYVKDTKPTPRAPAAHVP